LPAFHAVFAAFTARLMHHAHLVTTTGDSHRLAEALAGKGVVPCRLQDRSASGGVSQLIAPSFSLGGRELQDCAQQIKAAWALQGQRVLVLRSVIDSRTYPGSYERPAELLTREREYFDPILQVKNYESS
jgi:hypothetical protein